MILYSSLRLGETRQVAKKARRRRRTANESCRVCFFFFSPEQERGNPGSLTLLSRNSGSSPKGVDYCGRGAGGTHARTHARKLCGFELRAWSADITDLSRFAPDVTCSLTKFWPLHHSFKIAKSVQRNDILRTVTSAAAQMMQ